MAKITLENLTKHFGPVVAVDDVNLVIEDGEFFALLGPSGCGKTTTLRLIAGLEKPTEGRIFIDEEDVTSLSPRERDVAMVFQDYALYPHMTILDNIAYPLKVRGVPRDERVRRVREVAKNLQIAGLLDRRPGQLSGGQQQRAAVARAVVHHPRIFLFDEPLSNLDAKLRLEARAFLKHLQREVGVTSVYVTHDQAEAMALADRIAVMNQGRILQVGTPLDVYRHPRNTFVAQFLGSPPMNLIPCQLERTGDEAHLVGSTFDVDISFLKDRLPGHVRHGSHVFLGIRPEHLKPVAPRTPGAIPGEIYVVQPLGAETLINVLVEGTSVAVRLFADEPVQQKGVLWVAPDVHRIHIYQESGEIII